MKAIDGGSFYSNQSEVRGISSADDVRKVADFETRVFDQLILPYLPSDRGALIYEAATGPGILQVWLQKSGYVNLMGSDFAEREAIVAADINPAVVHADSLVDLRDRVLKASCAVIIALDLYEHLPRESFREFLDLAQNKLAPGGVLILRGPNGDSPFVGLNLYNDITHVWAYTTVCLDGLLRIAGFQSINFDDDTIRGLHSGAVWKKWLMRGSQAFLRSLIYIATRQRIKFFGISIYVYARRREDRK